MMSEDGYSAEGLRPAGKLRHGPRIVARHPRGGGAVPRIPVVNVNAMRAAQRSATKLARTLHETKDGMLAGLAAVRHESARDGVLFMELTLMIVAIPIPAMIPPPDFVTGLSPGI